MSTGLGTVGQSTYFVVGVGSACLLLRGGSGVDSCEPKAYYSYVEAYTAGVNQFNETNQLFFILQVV